MENVDFKKNCTEKIDEVISPQIVVIVKLGSCVPVQMDRGKHTARLRWIFGRCALT